MHMRGGFWASLEAPANPSKKTVEMDIVRDEITNSLNEDERLRFLAILFRIAKVEQVSRSERDRLQPVAHWLNADENELADAMRLAYESGREMSQLLYGIRGTAKGTLLFRECCAVVWADGVKRSAEAEKLAELARLLGLSEESIKVLDTPLACSPEGERRFLEHLRGTSTSGTEE